MFPVILEKSPVVRKGTKSKGIELVPSKFPIRLVSIMETSGFSDAKNLLSPKPGKRAIFHGLSKKA